VVAKIGEELSIECALRSAGIEIDLQSGDVWLASGRECGLESGQELSGIEGGGRSGVGIDANNSHEL
jgi:hypothetical protein